ncbi:MAG: cell wall anchor protein [Muribaculaceae bacterium]
MTKILRQIILALVLVTGSSAVWAVNVVIKAKLDSATLIMGRQTALHLEISQDKNVQGYLTTENSDTLTSKVEIALKPKADTVDIDNGRIQIKRDYILQAFDSGMYVLPPLHYVVGKDTFETQQLSLKVIPVKVDTLKTVHDYKPVEDVPFKLFDWVPDFISDYWWVYFIVLLILGLAFFVYMKWLRHGEVPLIPKKKRMPPYEEAILRLGLLKEKKLWQSGQEKAYFTELTDILREYIERRFGINAVEMTTTQIIDVLRHNEETRDVNELLNSILELADFVKFANMRPLSDDNELAYQRAINFVDHTRPVEQPEGEEAANNGDEAKKDKEVKE